MEKEGKGKEKERKEGKEKERKEKGKEIKEGKMKEKTKIKEKKRQKGRASRARAGVGAAALVAAVAVFAILLQIEKNALAMYEKGPIYVAAVPVPKGEMITEENYRQYFALRELDAGCIPKTALKDPKQICGMAAVFEVEQGVLLTEGMFEKMEDILEDMEEPVIAGFKAEDIYQVAGGILRAGDRIHIYSITEEEETLVWNNVYIQQVFDAAGKNIAGSDKLTVAQRINIYLDKRDVEAFYRSLANGSLRVVKVP